MEFNFEQFIEVAEALIKEWRHKHRARHLTFSFSWCGRSVKGKGNHMQFTGMNPNDVVAVVGAPIKADGTQSLAVLSNQSYQSSDPTVFTVSPDPITPGGAVITLVGSPGASGISATLTETATAIEPDGVTTEVITGSELITFMGGPPPPSGVAASIVFSFGTPGPGPVASPAPKLAAGKKF